MYPQGLNDMFLAPMSGDLAMEQFNNASQTEQIGQRKSLQDMHFAAQKQPHTLEELMLKNKTTQAQLPGVEADSTLKSNQAAVSTHTLPQQKDAAMKSIFTKMGEDDLKMAEQALAQAEMDPSPHVRAKAQELRRGLSAYQMEKLKQDAELEKARGNNATQLEVARIQAEASKYGSDKRGSGTNRVPRSPQELYAYYAEQARNAPDEATAAQFTALANDQWNKVIEKAVADAAARKAGGAALDKLGIETRPAPTATPLPNPRNRTATQPGEVAIPNIKEAVEKSGGKYEPDKYMYRINPETGRVQRAPKGQ